MKEEGNESKSQATPVERNGEQHPSFVSLL